MNISAARSSAARPPISISTEFRPVAADFPGFPDIADTSDRPAALVYSDRNNFGPRFGFAYSRARRFRDFVVRGGYGIYYTPEITNSWTTLTLNPPIVKTFDFAGTFEQTDSVATAFARRVRPASDFSAPARLDPNLRDTYTQQWNLTVQKKLPKEHVLRPGLRGIERNNLTLAFDGNRPIQIVTPGPSVAPHGRRRPLQGFSAIQHTQVDRQFDLSLAADETGAPRRQRAFGARRVHLVEEPQQCGYQHASAAAPTWARSRTTSICAGPFALGLRHPPPAVDRRHLRSADLQQGFQYGGARAARRLAARHHHHRADRLRRRAGRRGRHDRHRASLAPDCGRRARRRELSRGERIARSLVQYGGFHPDAARGVSETRPARPSTCPGLNQVDSSATKKFRIRERHNFQFRAEFFNFFNHVNLGTPGLNIREPDNFGRVTSTNQGAGGMPGDARVVQFGLKYSF